MNNKGFSLMSVVVALGLTGILVAGLGQVFQAIFNMESYMRDIEDANMHSKLIELSLMPVENCMETLVRQNGGVEVPSFENYTDGPDDIFTVDMTSTPRRMTGVGHELNPKLELDTMTFYGAFQPNALDSRGLVTQLAELQLAYGRAGRGKRVVVKKIPIAFEINSTGDVVSCTSNPLFLGLSGDGARYLAAVGCPNGEFLQGFDTNGSPQCGAPTSTSSSSVNNSSTLTHTCGNVLCTYEEHIAWQISNNDIN